MTPQVCCSRRVLLKSRINWGAVRDDLAALPWSEIVKNEALVEELDRHLVGIVRARAPSKMIRLRSLDKPWFANDCRRAFDRKIASHRRWHLGRNVNNWSRFVLDRRAADTVYARAEFVFYAECKAKLERLVKPHKWWRTLKKSVFGTSTSVPNMMKPTGSLVYDSAGKAELLSPYFVGKQSMSGVELPPLCHPQPILNSLAFRAKSV